jgi:hypothetical protein
MILPEKVRIERNEERPLAVTQYNYTINLNDSELIMLQNLLNETVVHHKKTCETFKQLSDEGKLGCEEEVLKKLSEAFIAAVIMTPSDA